jgi:hypothetical protein
MKRILILLGIACFFPSTYANSQSVTAKYINAIAQADQFPGSDACLKLQAAIAYATSTTSPEAHLVDATHFGPVATCTSLTNPFSGLSGAENVSVLFGSTLWQIKTPWAISASGVTLKGMGAANSQIEFCGSSSGNLAVVEFNNSQFDLMDGFFIFGGPSSCGASGTLPYAFLVNSTHRSEFSHLSLWGAGAGLVTTGAVTDTFIKDHVSNIDADYIKVIGSTVAVGAGTAQPGNGFYFTNNGATQTTDGTVIDVAAEGVSGWGIVLQSANSMTFTSGTSENNAQGLTINSGSKYNTIIGMDIEANTSGINGVDVTDNAGFNTFQNLIASSKTSGLNVNLACKEGQDWWIGAAGTASAPAIGGAGFYGFTPFQPGAGATFSTTASGFMEMFVAGHTVYIPYFNTLP